MAAVSTIVAVGALTVAAAGTAVNIVQSRKAAKAQQRQADAQAEAQRKQAIADDLQSRRARMQQLREMQMKRAQIIAQGGASGTLGSSGVQGSAGSVTTQGYGNDNFVNQINNINASISQSLQRAAGYSADANKFSYRAGMGSSVAGLGMAAFQASGHSLDSLSDRLFGSDSNSEVFANESAGAVSGGR